MNANSPDDRSQASTQTSTLNQSTLNHREILHISGREKKLTTSPPSLPGASAVVLDFGGMVDVGIG